jgi:tight adherence protein C
MSIAWFSHLLMSPFVSAAAYLMAGCACYAYAVLERRDPLLRRVDAIAPLRGASPGAWSGFSETAGRVNWTPIGMLPPAERYELARRLARLGIEESAGVMMFVALRLLLTVAAAIGGWSAGAEFGDLGAQIPVAGMIAGLAIGWIFPGSILRSLVKRRRRAIEQGLPDALELLVVCTQAGMALEAALGRVALELNQSQPALAGELAITSAELKVLPDPDVALANLARRVEVEAVRTMVTCISQTLRYGTPLAQALRLAASDLRNASLLELEEQAGRLPVMLTIPMILLILPTVFMIVAGPSVIRALDTF